MITVRPARDAEREGVACLVRDAYAEFEPFLTPADWAQMMRNLAMAVSRKAEGDLLVAGGDQRLEGTVTYLAPGERAYDRVPREWAVMRVLAVAPRARGRGVGRMLAEECLNRARADKAPIIGLHTAEVMHAARTMYERMGFEPQREFAHLGIRFWIYALRL